MDAAEYERCAGIFRCCRAGRMSFSFAVWLITSGKTLVEAQGLILAEMRTTPWDWPTSCGFVR
jgi:hypothetical protein